MGLFLSVLLVMGITLPDIAKASTSYGDTLVVRFIEGTAAMTPDDSAAFHLFISSYAGGTTCGLLSFQNMKLSCWGPVEAPCRTHRNAFVTRAVFNSTRYEIIPSDMPKGDHILVWCSVDDNDF